MVGRGRRKMLSALSVGGTGHGNRKLSGFCQRCHCPSQLSKSQRKMQPHPFTSHPPRAYPSLPYSLGGALAYCISYQQVLKFLLLPLLHHLSESNVSPSQTLSVSVIQGRSPSQLARPRRTFRIFSNKRSPVSLEVCVTFLFFCISFLLTQV